MYRPIGHRPWPYVPCMLDTCRIGSRQHTAHGTRVDTRHKQQPQAGPKSSTFQLQPQVYVLKFSASGRMSLDDLPWTARDLCPVLK